MSKSTYPLKLPNSIKAAAAQLAREEGVSLNQFIAAAVSEKMASVMTLDYLTLEAAKGSRSDLDRFMNLVPSEPIAEGDELPKH